MRIKAENPELYIHFPDTMQMILMMMMMIIIIIIIIIINIIIIHIVLSKPISMIEISASLTL